MFDLDAQIVPGKTAAGVYIGQPVNTILANIQPREIIPLASCVRYDFDSVSLWAARGKITQIGLFSGYRGALNSGIKIGMTLQTVRDKLGSVAVDEDDNLVVVGSPGWCFESEKWTKGQHLKQNMNSRITAIYVVEAD